jgi:hypothetical protein
MLYLTPSGHAVRLDDDVELPGRLSIGSHGYAQLTGVRLDVVLLHRWLLGILDAGPAVLGDHINGDRLDCRRSNLRVVTPAESSANVRGRAASGYRGVYSTSGGRYYAAAKQGGRIIRLGVVDDPVEAAEVADAWRQEHLPGYVRR